MASVVASGAIVISSQSDAAAALAAITAFITLRLARSTSPACTPTAPATPSYSAITSRRATTAAMTTPASER